MSKLITFMNNKGDKFLYTHHLHLYIIHYIYTLSYTQYIL